MPRPILWAVAEAPPWAVPIGPAVWTNVGAESDEDPIEDVNPQSASHSARDAPPYQVLDRRRGAYPRNRLALHLPVTLYSLRPYRVCYYYGLA